jgi:hypothetical protein
VLGAGAGALASIAFVVAAPIAAVGSIAALRYYRRVTRETKGQFNGRVDRLMETYHSALDDLTLKERNRLTHYGGQILTPIFSRLDVLARRYAEQQMQLDNFRNRIVTLQKGVTES